MTPLVQRFLIGSGALFLMVGALRLYVLIVDQADETYFVVRLLVTLLSLVIARAILRVGLLGDRITRRSAISLIRSGSILLVIWGYRLYLIVPTLRFSLLWPPPAYVATFYVITGTIVMLVGLRLSRKLRAVSMAIPPAAS